MAGNRSDVADDPIRTSRDYFGVMHISHPGDMVQIWSSV
jgi:hypothetical protein